MYILDKYVQFYLKIKKLMKNERRERIACTAEYRSSSNNTEVGRKLGYIIKRKVQLQIFYFFLIIIIFIFCNFFKNIGTEHTYIKKSHFISFPLFLSSFASIVCSSCFDKFRKETLHHPVFMTKKSTVYCL